MSMPVMTTREKINRLGSRKSIYVILLDIFSMWSCLAMQKTSTFLIVITVIAWVAVAGIVEIGATTAITAHRRILQQPSITSNDDCLPGSVVDCTDSEENPPNSNDDCLPGSEVHCIDDHNNRGQQELPINSLLAIVFENLGVWQRSLNN
jgi:hypothetical protein